MTEDNGDNLFISSLPNSLHQELMMMMTTSTMTTMKFLHFVYV